jgi:hypothetical protein
MKVDMLQHLLKTMEILQQLWDRTGPLSGLLHDITIEKDKTLAN